MGLRVAEEVPLAPLTTLELGGRARFFVEARDEETIGEAMAFGQRRGLPVFVLGGGSNLVVPDAGYPGLVLRVATRGIQHRSEGERALCEVAAGEPWDAVVADCVSRGLAGLECLSGIPGSAGATPIQNVGAYGQEVAETIHSVRVLERRAAAGGAAAGGAAAGVRELAPEDCAFSYRDSAFKRDPQRHVVLAVTFALHSGGPPTVRYPELAAALAGEAADLARVRQTVLALRRRKSMVIDPADPNRRSVGSFFTNPIVGNAKADAVVARALAAGVAAEAGQVPRFPAGPGRSKLAAGWLIERAGIARGLRRGAVGVSTAHALALVHHGRGRTTELLALAREVRAAVEARFGVWLTPEPVILGARADDPLRLDEAWDD
jgi:UDP-N-acetylmuramate dehydrogenase